MDFKRFDLGDHIPKVIHQIFYTKEDLPPEIEENIRQMSLLNPSWEHRVYDDADCEAAILKYYGADILRIYHSIDPLYGAARADFCRYLLMYAEGGIYLDIKSAATQPLDDVIPPDARYILSKWDNQDGGDRDDWGIHPELEFLEGGEYQQWHIIAAAGHPFLRAVIERVIENIEQYNMLKNGVGREGVLRTTGPIAYTLAIEKVKAQHPFHEMRITQDMGIEYSIYDRSPNQGHHSQLFKKDYAKLQIPVITPRNLAEHLILARYRVMKRMQKLKKKVLRALRKITK